MISIPSYCSFLINSRDNKIEVSKVDLKRLIDRYEKLDYDRFLQLILPYHAYLRSVSVKKLTYDVPYHSKLNYSFENLLATTIKKEIDLGNRLEKLKSLLNQRYNFNINAILKAIDKDQKNFINEVDVAEYLKENGYEDKSELFVRRLDIDMDSKLSYNEFQRGVIADSLETYANHNVTPLSELKSYKKHKEDQMHSKYTFYTSYASPYKAATHRNFDSMNSRYKDLNYSYQVEKDLGSYIKETPVYKATSDSLAEAIKALILIEMELEENKVNLALQTDFNLINGFKLLDCAGKCYVSFEEFQKVLEKIGVKGSAEKLFKRYSRKQDNKLNYTDFCNMVLPKDTNYAYNVHKRHPTKGNLSNKALGILKTLIEKSIELEEAEENIRKELKNNREFDAYRDLKEVDFKGKGQITLSEVRIR